MVSLRNSEMRIEKCGRVDIGSWALTVDETTNPMAVGDTGDVSVVAPLSYGNHFMQSRLFLKGSQAEIGQGSKVAVRLVTPRWYQEIVLGPRPSEVSLAVPCQPPKFFWTFAEN